MKKEKNILKLVQFYYESIIWIIALNDISFSVDMTWLSVNQMSHSFMHLEIDHTLISFTYNTFWRIHLKIFNILNYSRDFGGGAAVPQFYLFLTKITRIYLKLPVFAPAFGLTPVMPPTCRQLRNPLLLMCTANTFNVNITGFTSVTIPTVLSMH